MTTLLAVALLTEASFASPDGCDPTLDGSEPGVRHCYFKITVVYEPDPDRVACAWIESRGDIHSALFQRADANNVIAFFEPGLMGKEISFLPQAPGFARGADYFTGQRLRKLTATEGGEATLWLQSPTPEDPPPCAIEHTDDTERIEQFVPTWDEYFEIKVVDPAAACAPDCGLPLVRVREETGEQPASLREFLTDSSGLVAFHDRALWQELGFCGEGPPARLAFTLESHGYRTRHAVEVDVCKGGRVTLELERLQYAERRYRVTGAGIHRDAVLLGLPTPIEKPLLNAEVPGQDTVQTTLYDGRLFWLWNDTNLLSAASFHTTAAFSALLDAEGKRISPERGIDLDYIDTDADGRADITAQLAPRNEMTWILSLAAVPRSDTRPGGSRERLYAVYVKPQGEKPRHGLASFDDETQRFVEIDGSLAPVDEMRVVPSGHTYRLAHDDGEYVYFQNSVRVLARESHIEDLERYESFTPLVPDGAGGFRLDRVNGGVRYAWRADTPTVGGHPAAAGLRAGERLFGHLRTPDLARFTVHRFPEAARRQTPEAFFGSTAWNEHRGRFIRFMGTIFIVEMWYAEADTPLGPWVYLRKIVQQDMPSPANVLYLPRHHPYFDDGSLVYVEGTFVGTEKELSPRYSYNQLMFALDLDDSRLALPVPVYVRGVDPVSADFVTKRGLRPSDPDLPAPFMALDRPRPTLATASVLGRETIGYPDPPTLPASVPVFWSGARCAAARLEVGGQPATPPLFHALPAGTQNPLTALENDAPVYVPLYEHLDPASGRRAYATEAKLAGFPNATEIARVWTNPIEVILPVTDYLAPVIADAGGDQCPELEGDADTVSVSLSGAALGDGVPESVLEMRWKRWSGEGHPGAVVAHGPDLNLQLEEGIHVFALEVLEDMQVRARDTVVVEVMLPDSDGDGIADRHDNCILRANADQRDTDSDGHGNVCDMDYDNDGMTGAFDALLLIACFGLVDGDRGFDPDVDHDGDGIIGGPDFVALSVAFGSPPGPSGGAGGP